MTNINLPVALTSFVGRHRELAAIQQLVAMSRLVTLTGASGCGKTRLALQTARAAGSAFADGTWLVELASLRDAALLADFVAQALDLHPLPGQTPHALLLDALAPRRMLLVLDNCEHLAAACADLAHALLSAAPNLVILATSREPLAVAGEVVYGVAPLSLPSGPGASRAQRARMAPFAPQDVSGSEAIQLFVERARAILPGFGLTAANTAAVVEICCRLDGIPLAIELAGARVNVLTVDQIAARLDDRFALLVTDQRKVPIPHHRTLRKAIDWSYDLLSPEEQMLLRRLAIFEAGFTLDAATVVCAGDGIVEACMLDLVSSLVKKSLVVATTLERMEARYRLLDSIAEYARERLSRTGEAEKLRDRHLDMFLARAEEAGPRLGDAYQKLWMTWLEDEHDNVRAALDWALQSGRVEAGLRITLAIMRFWEVRGHVRDGLAWLERLLSRADDRVSVVIRVDAHTYAVFMHMLLGQPAASASHARAAVALAEGGGTEAQSHLAFALSGLATSLRASGDLQGAYAINNRLLPVNRASGTSFALGMALLEQGGLATELGDYAQATDMLTESLALAREAGDAFRAGHALNHVGDLARVQGDHAGARSAYLESAGLLREVGAQHDLAGVMGNLGHACLLLGDVAAAREAFDECMSAHQLQHNLPGVAEALVGFAAVACVSGQPGAGARLLAASAAIGGGGGSSVWPLRKSEYARYLSVIKSGLTEGEFQKEHAIGSTMSPAQAAQFAQSMPLAPIQADPTAVPPADLTSREREIAALIGRGRTNGEIAADLVLSKRTVETHVGRILAKLGLGSRAHVVRWAIDHGLARPGPAA